MIEYINPNTIANTVKMGGVSKRPKTIYLAVSEGDVQRAHELVGRKNCRVIPAHSRDNALQALQILAEGGYEGVFAAVGEVGDLIFRSPTKDGYELAGKWEEVLARGDIPKNATVRVSVMTYDIEPSPEHQPITSSKMVFEITHEEEQELMALLVAGPETEGKLNYETKRVPTVNKSLLK